jgi:hypothetical protein
MNSQWFCASGVPPLRSECCVATPTKNSTRNTNTSILSSEEVYPASSDGANDNTTKHAFVAFIVAWFVLPFFKWESETKNDKNQISNV